MAASPKFKIYDAAGQYQAACHEPEAAAALVSFYGDGATIRDGHQAKHTVWTEGRDGAAGESYDHVAEIIEQRI
jgi:tRNA A37 threonylcarbamoyltransferase TsaD